MTKKNNQHINPKTYLKHFAEDKFVYSIKLDDKFQKKIYREGVGHKMFTKKRYYNFPNRKNEPILENMFSIFENDDYNKISNNIENRIDLGITTKELLVDWILMMKYRSSKFRDNFSEAVSWAEKTMERLRSKSVLSKEKKKELEQKGKSIGKKIQLSAFLEEEQYIKLRKSFFVNFMSKNWVIMESKTINFITSDNPGYSFTSSQDIIRLNLSPISSMYNLNQKDNSTHVFPLTYNKCLFIIPFSENDVVTINERGVNTLLQKEIEFKECSTDDVNIVNDITASLAHELIIGKKEIDLKKYFKK